MLTLPLIRMGTSMSMIMLMLTGTLTARGTSMDTAGTPASGG